ncbi:hypothetical protein AQ490_22030 [Wenjunlia vitaminophila]|uniref:Uncharacterized protein n=1 Tax=Wenjunlia vitaminophila TaxID=76728 RepID=A0A0T6LS85_WENVI|nr:hypothetical protein AQ490_22030 [Wenjunlia vitaminophila]
MKAGQESNQDWWNSLLGVCRIAALLAFGADDLPHRTQHLVVGGEAGCSGSRPVFRRTSLLWRSTTGLLFLGTR